MGVVRVLSRKHQANELKRIKIIGNQRAAASVREANDKKTLLQGFDQHAFLLCGLKCIPKCTNAC